MSRMPFIKFSPDDWQAATLAELSIEEEGLYIRSLAYMWRTGKPLPANDRLAAKLLLVQPLKYEKVMGILVAKGKMTRTDGSVFNERALRDIEVYQAEQSRQSARANKRWKSIATEVQLNDGVAELASRTRGVTPHRTPRHTPHHTPPVQGGVTGGVTPGVASGKGNEINGGADAGFGTGNAIKNQELRTKIESPKPPEGASVHPALQARDTGHPDVAFEGGVVTLVNGQRSDWLQRFGGDDERLNLALIEVGNRVQWGSSRPVASQVFGQLANIAGRKREGDNRYQSTVRANAKPSSKPSARLDQSSPEAQMVAVNIWEGAIRR
jgi:uncharacterized protein YdaU (DUF1376 family)